MVLTVVVGVMSPVVVALVVAMVVAVGTAMMMVVVILVHVMNIMVVLGPGVMSVVGASRRIVMIVGGVVNVVFRWVNVVVVQQELGVSSRVIAEQVVVRVVGIVNEHL